jgi:hypothetical protein
MGRNHIVIDPARTRKAASLLFRAFAHQGIHGSTQMPEDECPVGMTKGTIDHILFITLTVAIDYQRDAPQLWAASRATYADDRTRYLFSPQGLFERPVRAVVEDLHKHGVSRKPQKDAEIWRTVALTFLKKWAGDPRNFLTDCGWHAPTILSRLKADHHTLRGREVPDYPYLRGDKIGPLWLRMLRDNVGESRLVGLERVPIPVDVHVARATFALGVVRGRYSGPLDEAYEMVREAWFAGVQGLEAHGRPMVALDVDEALWNLSRLGCTNRDKTTGNCPVIARCEAKSLCVLGKIVVNSDHVEFDT